MEIEENIKGLVFRFKNVLDSKENILSCFCKYGVQVEGWLKGELLCFLDNEMNEGRIDHFDREVLTGTGRKRTDFMTKTSTSLSVFESWIELKHWLIGYQKGVKYNAQFYFGDPSSVGIKPDVEKLIEISTGDKFLLILATEKPDLNDWSSGIDKFNIKFSPLHIISITDTKDFPSFYYLGLLKVTKV